MLGTMYERQGRVDEAIAAYEANVAEWSPYTASYKRLAIIYRRQARSADERRIVTIATQSTPSSKARQRYSDRLRKMKEQ
jgi:hypothetical protein